ncbi:MAG: DNA recombination protein RmuC, partial [Limisphaerales bacterium]
MPSIVYVLMGVVIGAVLGWAIGFVKGRKSAPLVGADNRLEEDLKQRLDARERELADARQQATRVCVELAKAESERDASHLLLEKAQALHEKTLAEARLAQDKALVDLREAFKALSADALKQTQPQFLALANETLAKFQETAKGDLGKRQEAIAALVQPLKEQLESYQRRLQQSDTAQASTLGEVKKQLESLAQNSQTLSSETLQLRKVLSSNQARGRWGEETLRNVVEAAGMSAHCDFTEQDQSGDSKPDLTIRLPGNRIIIVDAKVPDLDFLSAMDSADELKRNDALSAHAAKLKATIKALADRDYPRQFQNALDYVVLFLPAESLFSAALEADRDLIVWAAKRQIMLATPASLIALLRAVSMSWQQHAQTENAREIAENAQELFLRVVKFTEHFEKIRSGLEQASRAYNDAVGSYETRVRPSGEKLLKLGGDVSGQALAEGVPVETMLRLP